MKPLSASEAVWPALKRTRRLLFLPFELETYLRLAAVAALTEGVLVSVKYSVSNDLSFDNLPPGFFANLLAPEFVTFTVLAVLVAVFLLLLTFYLVIHLRFAFFHCLIHGSREIRPAWEPSRKPAVRFFKASLVVWLVLATLVMLVVSGFGIVAFTVLTLRTPDGKLDPGVFLILFLPCAGFALLVGLVAWAMQLAMNDFVLPHMALEGLSFRQAWAEARLRMRADRERFVSYFILRALLPLVTGVALVLAALPLVLIVFGLLSMSAQGFQAMLEDATGAGAWFRVGSQVLFALMALGLGLLISFTLGGPLAIWMRYYAICFYGGRYKALGDILSPQSPAAQEGA